MDQPKDLTSINDKMAHLKAQLDEKRMIIIANLARIKNRGEEIKEQNEDTKNLHGS